MNNKVYTNVLGVLLSQKAKTRTVLSEASFEEMTAPVEVRTFELKAPEIILHNPYGMTSRQQRRHEQTLKRKGRL